MQKIKADKEQQNLKRKETVGALETTDTDGSKSTILLPKLYKESKAKVGTLIEIPYDEPRDLLNYTYRFI